MRDGSFLAGVIKDGDIFINSIMNRFYIEALTHGITVRNVRACVAVSVSSPEKLRAMLQNVLESDFTSAILRATISKSWHSYNVLPCVRVTTTNKK